MHCFKIEINYGGVTAPSLHTECHCAPPVGGEASVAVARSEA